MVGQDWGRTYVSISGAEYRDFYSYPQFNAQSNSQSLNLFYPPPPPTFVGTFLPPYGKSDASSKRYPLRKGNASAQTKSAQNYGLQYILTVVGNRP